VVTETIVDLRPARYAGAKLVCQLLIASNTLREALLYGYRTGLDPRALV